MTSQSTSPNLLTRALFDQNGMMRSGWRILFFLAVFTVLAIGLGIAGSVLVALTEISEDGNLLRIYSSALSLICALGAGWIALRLIEGLPFRSLGAGFTRGWFSQLVFGLVVGTVTVLIAVLIPFTFGGLTFSVNSMDAGSVAASVLTTLVLFAVAGAWEEAFLRGYILQTLFRSGLVIWSIIFTSVAFSLLHFSNDSFNWFSFVNTILAGILFAVAYMRTRSLWFPTGIHVAWNWVMHSIFGIEVSGLKFAHAPLLLETDAGPWWLTGGTYGLEGGIACPIALLIAILFVATIPWLKKDDELARLTSEEFISNADRGLRESV